MMNSFKTRLLKTNQMGEGPLSHAATDAQCESRGHDPLFVFLQLDFYTTIFDDDMTSDTVTWSLYSDTTSDTFTWL